MFTTAQQTLAQIQTENFWDDIYDGINDAAHWMGKAFEDTGEWLYQAETDFIGQEATDAIAKVGVDIMDKTGLVSVSPSDSYDAGLNPN